MRVRIPIHPAFLEDGLESAEAEPESAEAEPESAEAESESAEAEPKSAEAEPESAEAYAVLDLTEQQSKIYNYILKNDSISTRDVQTLFGVKTRRARQILSDMCNEGYLKRTGATSNLKYVLND